jgi:hypothetical protein
VEFAAEPEAPLAGLPAGAAAGLAVAVSLALFAEALASLLAGKVSGPRQTSSISVPFGSVCMIRTGNQPNDGASHTSIRRRSPSWRGRRMK